MRGVGDARRSEQDLQMEAAASVEARPPPHTRGQRRANRGNWRASGLGRRRYKRAMRPPLRGDTGGTGGTSDDDLTRSRVAQAALP